MMERCAECAWYSDLRHNFQKDEGFEQSFCCIAFPIVYRDGYVVEVHPDDMCEMFQRAKAEDLIHECIYFKDPVVRRYPPASNPIDLKKMKIPKDLKHMSYEPPINVMLGQLETQIENEIMTVVRKVSVDVDKYELLRALQYDRDQYNKGYDDARTHAHAHWIIGKGGQWAECSNCHEDEKIAVMEHKDYCPACGSIMDEESVVVE